MKRKENKIKTIFFMLLTICMMTVLMHDSVSASNVRLNRTQVQIVRGDTYRLYVKGTTAKVKWYSSNAKIATVSNGKVTAKKKGPAVIYAKVNGKKYACKVTVVTQQRAYIDTLQRQINIQRRRYGFNSYDRNPLLQRAAQKRAKELAEKFSHARPNGYSWASAISMRYNFKKASELTARYYTDPQEVVDAWMSRASTKAKIISKRYNEIGVGVYLDEDGFLYYAVIVAVRK